MMEPSYRRQELAAGRWGRLSLAEQLGNVGSEVAMRVGGTDLRPT
jgi:hypothetical protein